MIIGQVNRQVRFSSAKSDTILLNAASSFTAARAALKWAQESGNTKKIAEATKRLDKATQDLKKAAGGKKISMLNQKNLDTSA